MKLEKKLLPVVLLLLAVAGCGSTRINYEPSAMDEQLRDLTGQNGRTCLYANRITGYGAISESVLNVSTTQRKQYLMVMIYRCPDLEQSPAAVFAGAFGELCGGGRDRVGLPGKPCPIRSIYEFESRDAAFEALEQAEANIQQQQEALVD